MNFKPRSMLHIHMCRHNLIVKLEIVSTRGGIACPMTNVLHIIVSSLHMEFVVMIKVEVI